MTTVSKMVTVSCIDCEQPIKLGAPLVAGQVITCAHCGAELEVISLQPLELDWAYLELGEDEEDGDWDWDEEEEEEED
jgi:alpha-aminoadipate carrier protein LysW